MIRKNGWRAGALLTVVLLFAAVLVFLHCQEEAVWTGAQLLTEQEWAQYTQYQYVDLSGQLLLDEEAAPIDRTTSTLYITVDAASDPSDWTDGLSIGRGYALYLAPDAAFDDPAAAVAQGHRFRLVVANGAETYMEYGVVFTTLPVLKIDSATWDLTAQDKSEHEGGLCLWSVSDPDEGDRGVVSSKLPLHMRGSTTSWMDKKSWKLSLKTEKGKNNHISLLGLGEDDDWILNGMQLDDLKLRERLTMDIWNQMQTASQNPLNMSTGEYVELVANGSYQGLYLLQRRVDEKYLELEGDYVLMKSQNTYTPQNVREAYELVAATVNEAQAFAVTEGFFSGADYGNVDLDSWIDMMLLVQMGNMEDNRGQKNMFYLWQLEEGAWRVRFIPWDTDMSFGIDMEERFVHVPEEVWNKMCIRVEYSGMYGLYPDLDARIASRWQQLRQGAMSDETIMGIIETYDTVICSSGARARDAEKWGLFYSDDTIESLTGFVQNRLGFLDAYYGAMIQ